MAVPGTLLTTPGADINGIYLVSTSQGVELSGLVARWSWKSLSWTLTNLCSGLLFVPGNTHLSHADGLSNTLDVITSGLSGSGTRQQVPTRVQHFSSTWSRISAPRLKPSSSRYQQPLHQKRGEGKLIHNFAPPPPPQPKQANAPLTTFVGRHVVVKKWWWSLTPSQTYIPPPTHTHTPPPTHTHQPTCQHTYTTHTTTMY